MALANYTLNASAATSPSLAPVNSEPLRVNFDDLLYSPEGQQQNDSPQDNEPFLPPTQRRPKLRKRAGSTYLPPPNQFAHYPRQDNIPLNPYGNLNPNNEQIHTQIYQQQSRLDVQIENQRVRELPPRYDNNGQYIHDPSGDYDYDGKNVEQEQRYLPFEPGYIPQIKPPHQVPNFYNPPTNPQTTPNPLTTSRRFDGPSNQNVNNFNFVSGFSTPSTLQSRPQTEAETKTGGTGGSSSQTPPDRPRGFTKVETGSSGAGSKTQLHAVLDYDEEDYYDDVPSPGAGQPAVTPLQGPILLRNGSVPVVPLTSYNTVNNGSFYQIPILWTALSLALGYELQGQIVRGVPCVKRNYQLYCPTAGNTYPLDKIENFIDENKALIKRMYGSFATPGGNRVRRAPGVPDLHSGDSYFRHPRQAANVNLPDSQSVNNTGRLDACESKTEIMTPYWALNSARKLRAIVNTMHFEQAIHQEVCSKKTTPRCSGDCGCEQKYKWHRLLAYDPNDDCAGIFMDWFLFPSCCVCRCNP